MKNYCTKFLFIFNIKNIKIVLNEKFSCLNKLKLKIKWVDGPALIVCAIMVTFKNIYKIF